MKRLALITIFSSFIIIPSMAQSIGGNASLSVSTSSNAVTLPALTSKYPAVVISPAPGATGEVFYNFGASATVSSPALAPGGLCFAQVGSSITQLAAITASGMATLRITQLSQCPQQYAYGEGGAGGTTPASPPYNATPLAGTSQYGLAPTSATVNQLIVPGTATIARVCVRTAEIETTEDGTTPTTAPKGTAFLPGSCTILSYNQALTFKMISAAGLADVEYFK